MCVIMVCKKGVLPPYEKFRNAVWNNPHGWGLIMKENGRLEVKRGFKEEGTDPDELYKLMGDNDDVERILHVRWATEGDKTLDNTHPFPVFSSNKRDVYFMHNGTLSEYRPPSTVNAGLEIDLMGASDSKRFAELKLGPLLLRLRGSAGNADYSDPLNKEILQKYWSGSSKGILISNDLENMYFNQTAWSDLKYTDKEVTGNKEVEVEKSWYSSNNEYYDKLIRGPVHEENLKKIAAERARTQVSMAGSNEGRPEVEQLTCEAFQSRGFIAAGKLAQYIVSGDIHSSDNVALLGSLTIGEIDALSKEHSEATKMLLITLSQLIRTYFEEAEDSKADLENAQRVIVETKTELADLMSKHQNMAASYKNLAAELEALKQKAKNNGSGQSSKAA